MSCVVGSRSPGWRAAGGCGVDGSGPGVRLVPVLFEFFLDSALGDGELRGGGFFGGLLGGNGPFDRLGTSGVGWGATAPPPPGFPPRIEYGAGSPRERRFGWARYERSWLRCYGPRRAPGFPPRIEYGAGSARERRLSHPHPSPLPSREGGFWSREAGGHVGPPLRPGSHPHPSPLPSRERGFWSRERRVCTLTRRGSGGLGAGKRADTWVRPYGG